MRDEGTDPGSWKAGTWEGARREQLRRALKKTVRERLKALEELARTSGRLEGVREKGRKVSE